MQIPKLDQFSRRFSFADSEKYNPYEILQIFIQEVSRSFKIAVYALFLRGD